jgi:hypothetical protein
MNRTLLLLAIGAVPGVGGMTFAVYSGGGGKCRRCASVAEIG